MDIDWIYVDFMTGEYCPQFMVLTNTSFVGQFVYPVGGEDIG